MSSAEYTLNKTENGILAEFILVGEKSGEAVCEIADGKYEIKNIFINPEYRRFGHASKLLSLLIKHAEKYSAKCIFAEFPAELLPLFEKNGFAKCGVTYEKDGARFIKAEKDFVFKDAKWLSFGNELEAVIARKDFYLEKVEKTELLVTALGFSEIYVNGKSISDRLYAPAWTNYNDRDLSVLNYPIYDILTFRIFYEKIDITDFLKEGENTIVFHIGGGWYCQHESRNEGINKYGALKLCFVMKQDEKTVLQSDETVKYTKSFITRANIYFGEVQDLRIGYYDFSDTSYSIESWKNADVISAPLSLICEQTCPADRVVRTVQPVCIFRRGDYAVYDIGENVAGFPVIKFRDSDTDEKCVIRFSEDLDEDGNLNFRYSGGRGRIQMEEYISDGKCTPLHQHFTWHGARYFEVLGGVDVIEYRVAHTDIKKITEFKSSEPVIQWIFDAYIRTQLDNIHCCVPSDCPHRERLGYTGDGQLASRAVMTCFDAKELYLKWMQDVADSQDIYRGHVEHTAPFYGGGGGPGGWGGAIVFTPYNFYEFYKDKSVLEKYYPNMLLYLDYMENHSENGLVVRSEKGGWCLGDWCSPGNKNLIPPEFVNTYFYIKAMKQVIEISGITGKPCDELKSRLERVEKNFVDVYFDEESGTFCNSTEASDAYAYDIGLGNEKTFDAIVKKYENLGEFDTGIFGTDILIRVLCENGKKDLAKKLLTSKKENTFYNMMSHGATTLWENWDGCDSRNHPMFGAVVESIVKYFNEI